MRIIHIYVVLIVAVLTLSMSSVVAQGYSIPQPKQDLSAMSNDELWNSGNTAYANDNFIGAELFYDEILNRGFYSSELYYNLGNVYHKSGDIGRSILFYYRALQLSPADGDILHNIQIAESKTKDNIESIPTFFLLDWSRHVGALMGCLGWSITSLVLLAFVLCALLIYLLAEHLLQRRIGFWNLVVFSLLFAISTHYALKDRDAILDPNEAIVMSSSISVKSSPSDVSTELFILHEGTKVTVISSLEQWCEVVLADGKRGWVECTKIERI